MRLLRIGSTGPAWAPNDMTGAGAASAPGRWNDTGESVIYAAPTLAMAVLETAAHIDDAGLPLNKYVIEIDVPDSVWAARTVLTQAQIPGGWDSIPHGVVSIKTGSDWYKSGSTAIIELPSVIVPEESIVLINATHPDTGSMKAATGRRFQYNLLFRPK